MFTRNGSSSAFDSVVAVEGTLKRSDVNGEMSVDLKIMYLDHKSGITYGTCKVSKNLFGKETREHLENFLASAEKDFGSIAFGEGAIVTTDGSLKTLGSAEDPTGKLDPKSLGGV